MHPWAEHGWFLSRGLYGPRGLCFWKSHAEQILYIGTRLCIVSICGGMVPSGFWTAGMDLYSSASMDSSSSVVLFVIVIDVAL